MKAKLTIVSKQDVNTVSNKTVNFLLQELFKQNVDCNQIVYFGKTKNIDLYFENNEKHDYQFILVDENIYEWVKLRFAENFKLNLVENAFAYNYASSICVKKNIKLSKQDRQHVCMPENSRAILNRTSFLFGFVCKLEDCTYFFLPNKFNEIEEIIFESISKFIENEEKRKYYSMSLKLFGLTTDEILTLLNGDEKHFDKTDIKIIEEYPETTVLMRYNETTPKVVVDGLIRMVCERLNEFIVDDSSKTLSQIALEILEVQNKTLSIFESFTAGKIINTIYSENKNSSKYIKISKINLNLEKPPNVDDVIYKITLDMLVETGADCVLAVLNQDEYNYLIAVGDKKNIHIFKDLYKDMGTSAEDYATKTALFYLIKKLNFKDY